MGIGLSHRISFSSPIFVQRRPGVPGRHRFVPELTIMNIYTPVERRDSDATCPKCGGGEGGRSRTTTHCDRCPTYPVAPTVL